jgi:hypothetical protein
MAIPPLPHPQTVTAGRSFIIASSNTDNFELTDFFHQDHSFPSPISPFPGGKSVVRHARK